MSTTSRVRCCTADEAVGTAWDSWVASLAAMQSSGSCNSTVSYDPPLDQLVQPSQCGEEDIVITVKVTATDLCDKKECSSSFTLKAYPGDLALDACPQPVELDGCTADEAVGTAWDSWIASLAAMQSSGSCNSTVSYDPPLDQLVQPTQCGEEDIVITVKVTATDLCDEKECSSSFTLKAYPGDLALDACPQPVELDGCTADEAVGTAWDSWVASLAAMQSSGSCNSTVSYDPPLDQLVQPSQCGEEDIVITVKVTATDLCDKKECSSSFTLKAYPGDLALDACPQPVELDGCTADEAVGTAWDSWVASLAAMQSSGSCNSTVSYDPPLDQLVQPTQCGEEDIVITVKVTATDLCDEKECSSSFTLKAYPDDIVLDECPKKEVSGCLSQDEIDAAFTSWIGMLEAMTTSGSCNPMISFDPPLDELNAPEKCADEDQIITVTVTSSDLCESTSCVATFKLIVDTEAPEITEAWSKVEECGPNDDNAFQAWLDNHGGATATDNCGEVHWSYEILDYEPGCCSTGEWEVKFTAKDDCQNASSTIATFKIVDTTAPELSCPADVTDIPCGQALPAPDASLITTWDNCVCTGDLPGDDDCRVTEDCITVSSSGAKVNPDGTVTYSFEVTSECHKDISYIAFSLPSGVKAITPADNSTYQGELGNYNVENTTNNPFYSIKFESLGDPFNQGETEVFTFTLPEGVIVEEFHIRVKYGQNLTDVWFGPEECEGQQTVASNGVRVEWIGDQSNNASGCDGDPIIITRTYRATDACGNSDVCHQRFIYRTDLVAPEIATEAKDETVECDGAGNTEAFEAWLDNHGGAKAEDDCNELGWSYDIVGEEEGCGGTVQYTVTFTATDACQNASTTTASFNIEDTTPPTIDQEAVNETVECDGEGNEAAFQAWLANHGGASASDICSGVSWSYEIVSEVAGCGKSKTYEVTFTATDDCDNSSETTAYFIIKDTTSPTITTEAADKTVECDGEGNTEDFNEWLSTYGGAVATDDCGHVSWQLVIDDRKEACGATGMIMVTFIAKDECNNRSETSATFHIVDTTPPTITVEAEGETVECDGEGNAEALQAWLDNHGGASAEDICGTVSWTYETSVEEGCGLTQVITAIFTVTDACGNPSTTTATFTIEDTTAPGVDAPATIDIACNDPLPTVEDLVGADACGEVTVNGTIDPYTVDICNGYEVTYRYTAADECGNAIDVTSTVNVLPDTKAPVINPVHPGLASIPNGGVIEVPCNNADPNWNPFIFTAADVEATDDCSAVTIKLEDILVDEGCGTNVGYVSKWECTWTATDECGNASEYTIYMLIVDKTAPEFHRPPEDVTVGCGQMPPMPTIAVVDNCSDVEVSLSVHTSPGECAGETIITRTWTAKDACGNQSSISQHIYQIDTEAPTIILIDELEGYQNGQDVYVDCAKFNDFIFLEDKARAIDNCDQNANITYDFRIFPPVNNCEARGYTRKLEVEWTATDGCGNASTFELTIYGVDETPPVFEEAPAVLCAVNGVVPEANGVSATDACGEVSLSVSDDAGMACGDGTLIIRTWVAEDNCGNISEFVQQIVMGDATAPVISINHPAFEGAQSGDEITIEADCANGDTYGLPDFVDLISTTDGCAIDGIPSVTIGLLEEGNCELGFLNRLRLSVTATDACGNMAVQEYTLTTVDRTGPVFVNAQRELTVDCSAPFPEMVATDACGSLVEMSMEEDGNFDVCNAANDPLIRTWTATDACGNATIFVQTIYVVDTTPPTFIDVPADACMEDGIVPPVARVTALDGCNNIPAEVLFEETTENGDCGEVIVRTWMTWDACGNKDTVSQRIIGEDTTPPTIAFSHPDLVRLVSGATLEMTCVNFQGDNVPDYDAHSVSVSDNCTEDVDVAFSYELVALGSCQTDGYLERYKFSWVATDPCGNSASLELYVNAVDVNPPVFFERPQPVVNLFCNEAIPAVGELVVVDDCSGVTLDFAEETTYPSPGMTAIGRTWIATDACGNSETVTQWIKIQDYQLDCHFLNYENEVTCGSDDNTITVAVTGGTGPYSYQWNLVDCDGIMVEGMDSPTLTFIAGYTPLNFEVVVTDINGCSTTCTLTVPCKKNRGNKPNQGVGVGVGNGNGNGNGGRPNRPGGSLVIYPNPSTGTYYLEFSEYFDKPAKVIVRNLVGQEVMTTKLDELPTEAIELNLKQLPDGMYTIMIEVDGEISSIQKVIKEQ
ncbi:MAG: T9SS type A sorting domain-containing protein [Saprospiraceae bacterium]